MSLVATTSPLGSATAIAAIETFIARMGDRNQLLVKVVSGDGTVGWGESGLSGRERAVAGAIDHFASFLVGRDCRDIGRIWQECYRGQYFEGGRVLTAAISAIDIALYDLAGKASGLPVHRLLGGKQRDRIPTFASCYADECDAVLGEIAALIEQGWDCVRIPAAGHGTSEVFEPRRSIAETARWIARIRERFGGDLVLGIDYHHRLNASETASFCQRLPAGALDFLEEPIRAQSPAAYRELRKLVDVPFAIGEEFSSKWEAAAYVEQDITQFLRLDICNIGGFTEAMKVIGWAEAHYIDLMPHNPLGPVCTAATVHMAATAANLSWMETQQTPNAPQRIHDPVIFPVRLELNGTGYDVPDRPGLGIEVDEAALRAATPQEWEPPHLQRPDGSYTNW